MDEKTILKIIDNNYQEDIINYLIDISIIQPNLLLHKPIKDSIKTLDIDKNSLNFDSIFIWRDDGNKIEFHLHIDNDFILNKDKKLDKIKNTLICTADKNQYLSNFKISDVM